MEVRGTQESMSCISSILWELTAIMIIYHYKRKWIHLRTYVDEKISVGKETQYRRKNNQFGISQRAYNRRKVSIQKVKLSVDDDDMKI